MIAVGANAYLQRHFLPRLRRHGTTEPQFARIMVANPCSVLSATCQGTG